jgi:hypothetical protein
MRILRPRPAGALMAIKFLRAASFLFVGPFCSSGTEVTGTLN